MIKVYCKCNEPTTGGNLLWRIVFNFKCKLCKAELFMSPPTSDNHRKFSNGLYYRQTSSTLEKPRMYFAKEER